jgi:hypothetical protein
MEVAATRKEAIQGLDEVREIMNCEIEMDPIKPSTE